MFWWLLKQKNQWENLINTWYQVVIASSRLQGIYILELPRENMIGDGGETINLQIYLFSLPRMIGWSHFVLTISYSSFKTQLRGQQVQVGNFSTLLP